MVDQSSLHFNGELALAWSTLIVSQPGMLDLHAHCGVVGWDGMLDLPVHCGVMCPRHYLRCVFFLSGRLGSGVSLMCEKKTEKCMTYLTPSVTGLCSS